MITRTKGSSKTMFWDVETISLINENNEVLLDIFKYFYPRQLRAFIDSPVRAKGVMSRNGRLIMMVKVGGTYGHPSYPKISPGV